MSFQSNDPFIANWSDGFWASTSRARRKIDALGWRKTSFLGTVAILTLLTGADECPSHELRQTLDTKRRAGFIVWVCGCGDGRGNCQKLFGSWDYDTLLYL
jgi:hypothetical protein